MQADIERILKGYIDPYLEADLVSSKALKNLEIDQDTVSLTLELGYPCKTIKEVMVEQIRAMLKPHISKHKINIEVQTKINSHVGTQGLPGLASIKNIIAVASGKGGVGKSTVAVNLALALSKEGASVGILDADVYGPSQPAMLGTEGKRPELQDKKLEPIESLGVQSMSIGYLIEKNSPMIWRGPMIGKALQQLMYDTNWRPLDYLIIDLPPGTGDIQLTLCQKIPLSGAVIVTTPQDMALLDVKRACEAFNKLNVPILGVVENMSVYHCPNCGHIERLFGEAGGAKLAQDYQLSFLGEIPLNINIRQLTDSGHPPVVQDASTDYAKPFYEIARKVAGKLALQKKDYSAKFGKIVIEK